MRAADKQLVQRLVLVQMALTIVVAAALCFVGWVHALSALAGGVVAVLATALFAWRVFVQYRAGEPERLLGRFYRAEIQRLVFVGLLFAGAVTWIEQISIGAMLGAFLLVQVVSPVIVTRTRSNTSRY